ncbi:MAG TPA: cache domain-containing protein [Candidatus Binatia bacterium]|nr:cache domain-containing protein [Candidatus Binatia bacterium]
MTKILYSCISILCGVLYLFSFSALSAEQPRSEEAKQIVALVDSAAALIESKGKDAFPELKKKGSKWYKEQTYVFVDDINGTVLVNPPSPEIEGKNLIDMKDAKGKPLIQEFIKIAKTKGSGWVDYWWPKPGENKPSKKLSYIKKASMPNGDMVIVGAGIYSE